MPDVDRYLDAIDAARTRRVRELSEIRRKFGSDLDTDPAGLNSKAVAVLTYANWEGFYNECVRTYVQFLTECGKKIREIDWMLLVGAFSRDFESLRARNHSTSAKHQFVSDLRARLECSFESFDCTTVEARSNLNFERLAQNYLMLNFDITPLLKFRVRIDRELVGWRHGVAHGDSPDLSALDVANHVTFAASLLISIADSFEHAMVDRM